VFDSGACVPRSSYYTEERKAPLVVFLLKIQKVSATKYFFLNTEDDSDERKLFNECQKELFSSGKKMFFSYLRGAFLQTSSLTIDVAEIGIRSFFKFENVAMMIMTNLVTMKSFSFLNFGV
jgi:hypothetical protein